MAISIFFHLNKVQYWINLEDHHTPQNDSSLLVIAIAFCMLLKLSKMNNPTHPIGNKKCDFIGSAMLDVVFKCCSKFKSCANEYRLQYLCLYKRLAKRKMYLIINKTEKITIFTYKAFHRRVHKQRLSPLPLTISHFRLRLFKRCNDLVCTVNGKTDTQCLMAPILLYTR